MKRKQKGGIEGIIATIIMVGLVIALIIAVILPMTKDTKEIGVKGEGRLNGLGKEIS